MRRYWFRCFNSVHGKKYYHTGKKLFTFNRVVDNNGMSNLRLLFIIPHYNIFQKHAVRVNVIICVSPTQHKVNIDISDNL